MKKFVTATGLFAIALFLVNCEKDDICDQPVTTPRLIVEFYDIGNPTILKNVTNLEVTGIGLEDSLAIFNGVSRIQLPLKVTEDQTAYSFLLNSTNPAVDNEDILTFNYTREDEFVSRGCGYKTVFELDQTNPVVQTDAATPDSLWMQNVTVSQSNVNSETEVHVKIYF